MNEAIETKLSYLEAKAVVTRRYNDAVSREVDPRPGACSIYQIFDHRDKNKAKSISRTYTNRTDGWREVANRINKESEVL
jgi:hypothetical protein